MSDARNIVLRRREALLGAAALPLLGAGRARGMGALAGSKGMLFGSAVRASQIFTDDRLMAAAVRDCTIVTPEIELKWAYIEPRQGHLDLTDADRIATFAQGHGMRMHGHALLWDKSIAPWAAEALSDNPDWAIVRRFLASVIPRFGNVTDTWDVVNEPMDMGHRMDGLRPSPFLSAFGPDYIRRALEDARLYAPKARLFLNEFSLDYDFQIERDKRYLFLKLLENLKKSGAPLDGVGLQAHLDLSKQPWFKEEVLAAFLRDIGSLGLEIRISEMDVTEADTRLPIDQRDARVAEAVTRYLDVAMDNRAVGTLQCWGLSDRYSWLPEGNRGLPLDVDFRAKPMRAAITAALLRRQS
jgi:endo-1,4-beta-xylanase